MIDKADRIRADKAIGNRGGFILSPIRQFDVFANSACKVVFANVNPTIGDVVDVRKNFLIEHDLIDFACMMNGIDRALRGRFGIRDVDI